MASHQPELPGAIPNPFTYHETENPPTPLNVRPKNVILFGETGVGKSSVINLMIDREVAETSPDIAPCTLEATPYLFTLSHPETSMALRIFDTAGLEESELDFDAFSGLIEKAQRLITSLYNTGGIDLLLFCFRKGPITNVMKRNYRLFFEFLCDKQVPITVVVTNLENERVMEQWWVRNRATIARYGIHPIAHACVTTLTQPEYETYAEKRVQSRQALSDLFHSALSGPDAPYVKPTRGWIAAIIEKLFSFLVTMLPFGNRQGAISNALQERCGFSPDDSRKLAGIINRRRV